MLGNTAAAAFLVAIILVLVGILFLVRRREPFVLPVASNEVVPQRNPNDAVWNRHVIQDSQPVEYSVEYPNAYYNELGNEQFLDALNNAFAGLIVMPNGAEWSPDIPVDRNHVPPAPISDSYALIVPWFLDIIQKAPYFKMPGDEPAPFQVVHDHWKSWASSTLIQGRTRYDIEVILYREAKYHGKHVSLQVVMDGQKVIGVMNMKILGIVFEDHFGLFPVVHSDKTDLENLNVPFDDDPLAGYPPIIDETIISAEVAKREKQKAISEKIEKLYKLEPPPEPANSR